MGPARDERHGELRSTIASYDLDGDGRLSRDEFGQLQREVGERVIDVDRDYD